MIEEMEIPDNEYYTVSYPEDIPFPDLVSKKIDDKMPTPSPPRPRIQRPILPTNFSLMQNLWEIPRNMDNMNPRVRINVHQLPPLLANRVNTIRLDNLYDDHQSSETENFTFQELKEKYPLLFTRNRLLHTIIQPRAPEECVSIWVRRCRGGGMFVQAWPPEMTAKPYKYEIRILTTLKKVNLRSTNTCAKIEITSVKTCCYNSWLNEFRFNIQLINRVDKGKNREFNIEVLDKRLHIKGMTPSIILRSKRLFAERNFWRRMESKGKNIISLSSSGEEDDSEDERDNEAESVTKPIKPQRKKKKKKKKKKSFGRDFPRRSRRSTRSKRYGFSHHQTNTPVTKKNDLSSPLEELTCVLPPPIPPDLIGTKRERNQIDPCFDKVSSPERKKRKTN